MTLDDLHRGFRSDYLDHATLTEQLKLWEQTYPALCRLESIGTTEEGRDIWMLTLGRDPDRIRPAVWVDGNMHAVELAGSSVALGIAEDVLRLHENPEGAGLSAPVTERLLDVLFYVVPRISPDGAEAVLKTARYVRSVPRDARVENQEPHWIAEDVDGDGQAFVMRKVDPAGELVESKDIPGLLVPRTIDDEGPFFKVYPEGRIENFDGHTIPDPCYLGDNDPDLNRNFPFDWAAEPKQAGAGPYPLSEVESRAIVQTVTARPHIFAWLNLHTFGGVFIRPLGDGPDSKMEPTDLALYRQLEAWATECTGYPTVSGFEQFTYVPETPLHGDLSDYAFRQRGAIAWVCELWDLFDRVGLPKKKRFVDRYGHLETEDFVKIARWDLECNEGRSMRPWTKFDHPQLGAVELGGVDPRFGMWNPPREELATVIANQSKLFFRMAALAPRLCIDDVHVERSGDVATVTATIRNDGYLPTYVLASSKALPWNQPIFVDAAGEGVELLDAAQSHREAGHLQGWGTGRFSGAGALFFQRTRGTVSEKVLSWTVRGKGSLTLVAGSDRTGWIEHTIEI